MQSLEDTLRWAVWSLGQGNSLGVKCVLQDILRDLEGGELVAYRPPENQTPIYQGVQHQAGR